MPTPLETFTTMAAAIAEAAAQSQLGQKLRITAEPTDLEALDVDRDADTQSVTGRFGITMDGTPGSMAATLGSSDEEGRFDFELVVALQGSDEQVVFTATVEDTMDLANSYQALLDSRLDPGADPDIQNTVV